MLRNDSLVLSTAYFEQTVLQYSIQDHKTHCILLCLTYHGLNIVWEDSLVFSRKMVPLNAVWPLHTA